MRVAGIMLLLLGLAGCTSSGSWFQRDDDPRPAPMANTAAPQQSAPQQALPPRGGPSNLSPAATAAAPAEATTGGGGGGGELLDCVTESCKINCSAKVKKQFQPKWCARFKEPE
jgi:hypothetical protein